MDKERRINPSKEAGKCPYCDSPDYNRKQVNPFDDYILIDCFCKCGRDFKETFGLMFQNWEED